jgi:D-alanyl-D-alanine carboxypeptidase
VRPSTAWAAGGIVSNADDITRFYAELLGGHLLRPDLLTAMKTPAPGTNDGLGLFRVDTACGPAFGHVGISDGYCNVVYARPDGSRVADVMINIDSTYVTQEELETAAKTALCVG